MRIDKFILGILLGLLPQVLTAQTLTQYEYWFDGDVSNSTAVSMGGTDVYVNPSISTDGLSDGIHLFSIRFRQSGGEYPYSPTYSQFFFKHNPSQGGKIEYWFDDLYSRRATMTLPSTVFGDEGGTVSLDMLDATKFPLGFHRLNMRMSTAGKSFGPVYSAYVLKLVTGLNTTLEYWVDNDFANRKQLKGSLSGKVAIFQGDLDLTNVATGAHRLHYRAVGAGGEAGSAVGEMPIMVKSRYLTEAKTSKVAYYSISVDNQEPVVHDVLNPSEEITIPYTYDARGTSTGKHTVNTKVWNSLGAMSTDKTDFTVVAQEKPSVTVEATEKNGLVTVKFNTIPNDLRYRVFRKDAGGNNFKVGSFDTSYPNALTKTDDPIEGDYKYFVQAIYTDYNGKQQTVLSNEVSVTVSKTQTPTEVAAAYGSIMGCIQVSGQQSTLSPLNLQMDVTFSDGVVVKSGGNGLFVRNDIPLGTKLSMTVKNNPNYTFDSQSITVDKDTRKNMYVIKATPVEKQVVEKSNESYDLVINSDITGIPNYFNFEVKNMTDKSWSGRIYLIAVKEKEDKNSDGALSFASLKPYHKVGTVSVSGLKSGASKAIELEVTDFPVISKNTFYNFYLVSESDVSVGTLKLVENAGDVAINPRRIEMEKNTGTSVGVSEAEIEQAVNDILSYMKEYKKYGGYLANALDIYAKTGSLSSEDTKALASFTKDLKEHLKGVGDVASFVSDVKSYYKTYETIRDWDTMDDFDKFVLITNKIFEWSGPCGKIYQTYLEVLERCKGAIDKILEDWFPFDLVRMYSGNNMKFHIKVIKKDKKWFVMNSYYSGNEIYDAIKQIDIKMYTPNHLYYNNYYKNPVKKSDELVMTKVEGVADQGSNGETLDGMRFYMKIDWKNGRTSFVPLLDKEIVKYKSNTEVIVTFKSESSEMADIIHLVPVD